MSWLLFRHGGRPQPPTPSTAELLLSRDGFAREAAARQAQRLGEASTLPLLLACANDWVPQVRAAAHDAVRSLRQTRFLADWCAALDAVQALERATRTDPLPLLADIRSFLGGRECLSTVVEAAADARKRVRRFVFDLQLLPRPQHSGEIDCVAPCSRVRRRGRCDPPGEGPVPDGGQCGRPTRSPGVPCHCGAR